MKKYLLGVLLYMLYQPIFSQELAAVYFDVNDSTKDYYIAVMPVGGPPSAFMVLLPGAFQTPEYVLQQTRLPYDAAAKGILTIIPLLKEGVTALGIDSLSQTSLDFHIRDAVQRFQLKGKRFFMGGFSLGGSAAVKYAERSANDKTMLLPGAVFAIDPPLDFERYYNAAARVIRLSIEGQTAHKELLYMTSRLYEVTGGTPAAVPDRYRRLSPYSFTDEAQTAVKMLVDMPVLFFTEPDVDWWLQERGYDYSLMNAVDQAAMVNELQRLGNSRALLVTTRDRGHRAGSSRHPHAYSIADPELLLGWLLQQQ